MHFFLFVIFISKPNVLRPVGPVKGLNFYMLCDFILDLSQS